MLEEEFSPDPLEQFARWFEQARRESLELPEAMTLATVDLSGHPDARMVLLKGFGPGGFRFFTSYESAKGGQLGAMPYLRFLAFSVAGALVWVFSLCLAGYFFGNLPIVKNNLTVVILGIIVLSVSPGIVAWLRRKRPAPQASVEQPR